ncbi:MAG TPA: LysE/ArgO family amino acid transporter [Spirochaetota bacterium]|nr:LysE/ArgO family amino acid transporter [Spirochaetota bacterium]
MGAGLIIAIGAQNAFVLKQGIAREHHLLLAVFCSVSDAILITAGVLGMGTLFTAHRGFTLAFGAAGAAYLLWFAVNSFRSAFRGEVLDINGSRASKTAAQTLVAVAALTWLNPHVYLDTVVMLGSFGASREPEARPFFAAGAIAASFIWFFSLAYGGRVLGPLFRKPLSWRILDCAVGLLMLYIAARMALFAWNAR